MMEREKREKDIQTSPRWVLGTNRIASMPLCLKLALLVLITLLTRVLAFLQPQIIPNDGVFYIQLAKLFSEGKYEGLSSTSFSLYPLMLFLAQKLIGDWELSGQLISLTLSTLTIIPVFLLGKNLYGEKVGWLSALFYIALPDFLEYGSEVLRDPTSWFFMATTLYLVWEGLQKNRPVLLGLASMSAGLGALTRVEGFILWGALAIFAAFRRVLGVSLRRRALNVTILILLFPLLLSPVVLSLKERSSQMALGRLISFPLNFITSHARQILRPQDPITLMSPKVYESLHYIPRGAIQLASRHRVVLAISEVIYKFVKSVNLLIILIFLGFWKRKRDGFGTSDWYLLFMFGALFVMSVFYTRQIYYFSTRHGLTLVLPSLFFAGHGLDFMAKTFHHGLNRFISGWLFVRKYLVHIITIFLIMVFLVQGISFKRTEKFIQKEIGLWLKEKGVQGSVIMGPKNLLRLAFYADGKFLEIPDSWEKIADSIQKNGVRIVVIDSCTIEQDCSGFLANWSKAGLFLLQGPNEKGGKCGIQIYGIY